MRRREFANVPRGPRVERRPADVIGAAVMVKRPYRSRSYELQLSRFLPHLILISAKEARDFSE